MKKIVLIVLALVTLTSVSAQQNLNDYKYVIVPEKFDFFKEADRFKLNSLTKFLFEKYNFIALMEHEILPSDLDKNICLALQADVIKESTMFKTKLSLHLKNCRNEVIFTSPFGESREKNYKIAYNQALRNAFKSIEAANYSYNPINAKTLHLEVTEVKGNQEELKKLREEVKTLKEKKVIVNQPVEKVSKLKQPKIAEQVIKDTVSVSPIRTVTKNAVVLYAQEIENGFQLVDNTPKVIYKIKETGMSNVYLVEGKNAIIYKLDANWILEYYENGKLETKMLHIKF